MNTIPEEVARPILKMLMKDKNYEGMKMLLNSREVVA